MGSTALSAWRDLKVAADHDLREALADLGRALAELGSPAMIIGGLAVIARGVPRLTIDIDATVWGSDVSLDRLFSDLERHRIVPRIEDARDFAEHRQILLLIHQPTGTPLEVSIAWLPFEEEALRRASLVDFGGVEVPVARAEDLIVYKVVAWRDRDKDDVERLLTLHHETIDIERVRSLVRDFAEALGDPGRVEEFEALLRRAIGQHG